MQLILGVLAGPGRTFRYHSGVDAGPHIVENVPLAPLTTLGVGGPARYFIEARDEPAVESALSWAASRAIPVFILGSGSNIVVSDDGFPGLVIRIALRGFSIAEAGHHATVAAAAGEDWDALVRRAVERGLAGVECLSGIPGTVGGTPVQNVGAYGQEVSETITAVRVFDRETGSIRELDNAQCGFTYRRSVFNTTARERYVVLSVTYRLARNAPPALRYADLVRYFAGRAAPPSLAEVREAVLAIRASKAMVLSPNDPDSRSAGSFFKNPIVSEQKYAEIAARFPAPPPRYAVRGDPGMVKMAAAWLIEQAGFQKGYGAGPAGISSKHTLAVVNRGGATAADVVSLASEIRRRVRDCFGIELAPEPLFIGFNEDTAL